MSSTRRVRGTILIPHDRVPAHAETVVVQVEDVSRADAPSEVVAEVRREDVALTPGDEMPFEIDVPADAVDDRRSYTVRVHVDVDGSGSVALGDLITMQSYPVLTRGGRTELEVEVRPV